MRARVDASIERPVGNDRENEIKVLTELIKEADELVKRFEAEQKYILEIKYRKILAYLQAQKELQQAIVDNNRIANHPEVDDARSRFIVALRKVQGR